MNALYQLFSTKAEKYARYRWDYAASAVQAIFDIAGLSATSSLADIGAGTGILTRHFAGRLSRVMAIEPNPEMRRLAARALAPFQGCTVIAGLAENLPLAGRSVDAITIAQAIHWFNPEPARQELHRLLKPGGWLAILRNYETDKQLSSAMEALSSPEYGVKPPPVRPFTQVEVGFYFSGLSFRRLTFPFHKREDWQGFFGALVSASYMPDEGEPGYDRLEKAARGIFDRFSQDGWIEIQSVTELLIGQVLLSII